MMSELWALGRVVGFTDGFGKRVLVEVKSSSEMQEVALRKQELLRRLRKVRGFENVVDVRFSVNG